MASVVEESTTYKGKDDEDLEKLRLAALMTVRKKPAPQLPPVSNVIFQTHFGNPNLIAIIPEGAEPTIHKHPPRQCFFRYPPPRPHLFRSQNTVSTIGSTLKVLPQVQIEGGRTVVAPQEKRDDDKEEVSTKFSRFEDSKSETEDESDNEKEESESSDESDDVLSLEDDDDSLEALMAQMEHEIEVGIDPEPNKKEKKKTKISKHKEKETKIQVDEKNVPDKVKSETKTAIVEPTLKEDVGFSNFKLNETEKRKSPSPVSDRLKSPVRIHPLQASFPLEANVNSTPPKMLSPVRTSKSPIKERSETPPLHYSPQRARTPMRRTVSKSRSPIKQRSSSPKRTHVRSKSPIARTYSPLRRRSPWKFSPDRRSPLRKTPDRYYLRNRSPSPYYKARDRDYAPPNRSRSPVRRRSPSPRKGLREPSPKYYHRRSRSPWSPHWRPSSPRPRSPTPRYRSRSRSPLHHRSLSPRNRKYTNPIYTPTSPPFRGSSRRRSRTPSPRRSKSPRKREYSPRRRQPSPRREISYRRNSVSPKRKTPPRKSPLRKSPPRKSPPRKSPPRKSPPRKSPPRKSPPRKSPSAYKKYSPIHSPKHKQRSLTPRRNSSPRRRPSPIAAKESRTKIERRSRTPSLSLSPTPPRETKEGARRYNSPLRPSKVAENMNNRTARARRGHSPDKPGSQDAKARRKPNNKAWERDREVRHWDRKVEERQKEPVVDKIEKDTRRERENNRLEKQKKEDPKKEVINLKVIDNPIFEARRKKFQSTTVIEPASKKIRLVSMKSSPVKEKYVIEEKKVAHVEEKKIVENSVKTEDDVFSGHEEIDEIDNFLNEDVLDLSAEVWSSDDELFPKINKVKGKILPKTRAPVKQQATMERISVREKVESRKSSAAVSISPSESRTATKKSKVVSPPTTLRAPSPAKKMKRSPIQQDEERKERDESDLRAELSRRREERLTKAGSLHEKLPARLLQSAFESALGKKKTKKEEEKPQKGKKESQNKEDALPPVHKERTDGRRVLVLKRPTPVKMQSAHINVTFPKGGGSDSETSYSSSSSDERYTAPTKRKLPVYMRLGTAQSGGRKVKLRNRRSQD